MALHRAPSERLSSGAQVNAGQQIFFQNQLGLQVVQWRAFERTARLHWKVRDMLKNHGKNMDEHGDFFKVTLDGS